MKFRDFATSVVCLLLTFMAFSQGYADEVATYRKNNRINTGKLKITNETSSPITVFLYHSDSPEKVSYQQDIESGESVYLKSNGNSVIVGSDWGYEVSLSGQGAYGGENVIFIGSDADYSDFFDLKIGVAYGNWWEAPEETDDYDIDLSDYLDSYYDEESDEEETCDYHTISFQNNSGVEIKIWVYFVPQGKTAYEPWVYRFKDEEYGLIGYTNMDFYWYAEEPDDDNDGNYHYWKGEKHVEISDQDFYMLEETLEGRPCEQIERVIW